MPPAATVHVFDIALSDVDRGVYEQLQLKVARHPSETTTYMVARVLAYCLEFQEGLAFGPGLSEADDPALWVRDLTGTLRAWIEVGTPDAPRLHRASKACDRVVVYCHKDLPHYLRALAGQRVFSPDRVSIVELDRKFLDEVAARVEKRTTIALSHTEGQLYADVGGVSLEGTLLRHPLPA